MFEVLSLQLCFAVAIVVHCVVTARVGCGDAAVMLRWSCPNRVHYGCKCGVGGMCLKYVVEKMMWSGGLCGTPYSLPYMTCMCCMLYMYIVLVPS